MSGRILEVSDDSDGEFDPQPGGNAKLSSLFSSDKRTKPEVSGFTYKPPKPPSDVKIEETVKTASTLSPTATFTPSLIYASAVSAYFQKDGEFVRHGKLGLALVRSGQKECHLLLYITKQQPIVQIVVNDQFHLDISHTYAQFDDSLGIRWSIAFDSDENLLKFVKWILAVQMTFGGETAGRQPLAIDVKLGDGESQVRLGDSVEIEFSECLIESGPKLKEINGNDNFGQVLRLRVGKGKVPKGWEEGLMGMCRNGLRVFAVCPSGADSPMLVTVSLKRVKSAKPPEAVAEAKSDALLEAAGPTPNLLELVESDVLPTVELAPVENSLKSRMARIGTPVLNLKPPITAAKPNQMAVFCASVTLPTATVTTATESHKHHSCEPTIPTGQPHMSTSTSATSPLANFPPYQPYPMPNFYPIPPWLYQPFGKDSRQHSGNTAESSSTAGELMKELRESQAQLQTSILTQFTDCLNKMTAEVLAGVDRKLSCADTTSVCDDVKLLHTELDSIKTQLKVPGGGETLGNVVGTVSDKLDSLVESAQKSNEREKNPAEVPIQERFADELRLMNNQLSTIRVEMKKPTEVPSEELRVRKILNRFYKRLSGHFTPDQQYSGEEIRQLAITAIKETTQSAFELDQSVEVQTELDSDPFQLGLERISDELVAEGLKEFAQLNCA